MDFLRSAVQSVFLTPFQMTLAEEIKTVWPLLLLSLSTPFMFWLVQTLIDRSAGKKYQLGRVVIRLRYLQTRMMKEENDSGEAPPAAESEAFQCTFEEKSPAVSATNPHSTTKKRQNYISWDEYFMAIARLSSMRSKDPSTQVGCCIVDPLNRIVGVGYNGFPRGCRY